MMCELCMKARQEARGRGSENIWRLKVEKGGFSLRLKACQDPDPDRAPLTPAEFAGSRFCAKEDLLQPWLAQFCQLTARVA